MMRPVYGASIAVFLLPQAVLASVSAEASDRVLIASVVAVFSLPLFLILLKNTIQKPLPATSAAPTPAPATSNGETSQRLRQLEERLAGAEQRAAEAQNEIIRISQQKALEASSASALKNEMNAIRGSAQNEMHLAKKIINNHEKTLAQQREMLQQKDLVIEQLQLSIHDLKLELRAQLQAPKEQEEDNAVYRHSSQFLLFDEEEKEDGSLPFTAPQKKHAPSEFDAIYGALPISSDTEIYSDYDAVILLHKLIQMAEKQVAPKASLNAKTTTPLDFKTLFANLKDENSLIVVYSRPEKRLIFASSHAKSLLGWTSEQFMQNFTSLLQEGGSEWDSAMRHLTGGQELLVRLGFRNSSGNVRHLQCYVGDIAEGPFSNHVLAVMYAAPSYAGSGRAGF